MDLILRPKIIAPYNRLLTEWDNYYMAFMESGRGSGKSQGATKAGFTKLVEVPNFVTALIRSENTRLEQGILKLYKMRADELNTKGNNVFDERFEVLDTKIKDRRSGIDVVFNYGLKSSQSTDLESKKGKAKGLEKINLAIIEEVQDVKDYEVIKTLIDTCVREKDFKIWMLFNPPKDRLHWLYSQFYDLVQSEEHDKYDRLVPKSKEGVLYLHSDYTQNPHLNEATVKLYSSYKESDKIDDYYHDILGLVPKDSGEQAIIKCQDRTNDSYRNPDTGLDWSTNSSFIKDELAKGAEMFVAIDDGAETVHPAAVLGFHCPSSMREIVLKEFTDYTSSLSLAYAIDEFIKHHKLMSICNEKYEVVADPALSWTANKNIYKDILGKVNMLDWMRNHPNKNISSIWANRLIKRTDNLAIITRAKCADGLPKLIIIKGSEGKQGKYDFGCPALYKGIFGGYFRWALNKAGLVERGTLDQIKYETDVCDSLTYYLLNKYPPV